MMALVSLERACAYRGPADGMGFYLFRSLRAILLYESRCFNIRNKISCGEAIYKLTKNKPLWCAVLMRGVRGLVNTVLL